MTSKAHKRTVVSSKGQIILPKAIRDELNWGPGTALEVEPGKDFVTLRPERVFKPVAQDAAFGVLDGRHVKAALEDFEKAIDEEVMSRHARGRY
jgi:AbrB family looped-hinge helix DNA binding protein